MVVIQAQPPILFDVQRTVQVTVWPCNSMQDRYSNTLRGYLESTNKAVLGGEASVLWNEP